MAKVDEDGNIVVRKLELKESLKAFPLIRWTTIRFMVVGGGQSWAYLDSLSVNFSDEQGGGEVRGNCGDFFLNFYVGKKRLAARSNSLILIRRACSCIPNVPTLS